jgi:hypothetical protein
VVQPTTTVATLLGTAQQAATTVPYSWSEQYGRRIQCAVTRRDGDQVRVVGGGCADRSVLAVYERDGRSVAVLGVDQPRLFTRCDDSCGPPSPHSADHLTGPGVHRTGRRTTSTPRRSTT